MMAADSAMTRGGCSGEAAVTSKGDLPSGCSEASSGGARARSGPDWMRKWSSTL